MADRPRVLLTGATGQVGRELMAAFGPVANVLAPTRTELDLEHPETLRAAVRSLRPDIVLNAAAYTAVDRAEKDVERCTAVNALAPATLAEETARSNALLIHYSTDYVFDGTKRSPYVEDDDPAPLNVYGRTKLAGERAIAAAGGPHVILRTSWIYGTTGTNFLRTMLRLASEQPEIRVVHDQVGAPTWSRRLAWATAQLVARWPSAGGEEASGVYHLSAAGSTTWYEFACAILTSESGPHARRPVRVVPTTSREFVTPAARPSYSLLDNGKVRNRFGVVMPDWRSDLNEVLGRLPVDLLA
jgi:dTDP-4-dehydrorhamnose reductase